MRYADEITAVAGRWAEMGHEVPDTVHVGTLVFKNMLEDAYAQSIDAPVNYSSIQFHSPFGIHKIVVDSQLDQNCIHMDRLTLNDILIDDILLDGLV